MDFFGIGIGEVLLVLIIGLIVLGPGKLTELAKSLGRLSRNLKKMSTDFTTTVNKEMDLQDKFPENNHHQPKDTNKEKHIGYLPEDTKNQESNDKSGKP